MSQVQYVQLLGPGRLRLASSWLDFAADKRFFLLAYLAYSGEWVSRDRLAYLFWPDIASKTARHNLRQLLKRVKSFDWLSDLAIEDERVRWSVNTDVEAFKTALDEGDWEQGVLLYNGRLLEGMTGDDVPEFAAWLEFERETLQGRWRALLFEQAGQLGQSEQHQRASSLLAALLKRDEFDEEALCAYMTASFHAGQRLQALEAYRNFSERLQAVLELEPTLLTRRLAETIRQAEAEDLSTGKPLTSGAQAKALRPDNLFVGRDLEMVKVTELLSQPLCRLLTLVGLGGVGKSRIAWQIAQTLTGEIEGGAHFIALDALSHPDAIPATISNALGWTLQGQADPLQQLSHQIGKQHMLLILDNFEQLIEGATQTSSLLQTCPNLKLLVTSRERLNVSEEWLYEVSGLSFPSAGTSLEQALSSNAVQLFLTRGTQVHPDYQLDNADLPYVLEICQLVQGLPLGLELAAVWLRSLSTKAIAQEIRASLDFLKSRSRNALERHESIRAVFEHSWQLLSPKEQLVLAKLAVFRGGFTREAAGLVASAPTPLLAGLVDKSLLALLPSGRYDRHPLLYQYMSEKLLQHEEAVVQQRHAHYFLAVAEELGGGLRKIQNLQSLTILEADHENLRAVLSWGLEHEPVLALRLAGALGRFWEIRGHLSEGCKWLAASLDKAPDASPEVKAQALGSYGRLLSLQGYKAEAEPHFTTALQLWRKAKNNQGVAAALNHLGALAMERGEYAQASKLYQEALELSRALNDQIGVAYLLNNLGEIARLEQNYLQAENLYQECLSLQRNLENQRGTAIVLGNLGFVTQHLAKYHEAAQYLTESIRLKHHLNDEIGLAYCFAGMAAVLCAVNKFVPAVHLLSVTERLMRLHSLELDAADRADYQESLNCTRAQLEEPSFTKAWAEAQVFSVKEAVAYALEISEKILPEL